MSQNSGISQNQFIPNGQQSSDPMFDNFMQACLNNPSFFESMKQFYTQAKQPRTNNIPMTRNNNQLNNSSTSSQPISRAEQFKVSYQDEEELYSTSQKQYRKENKTLAANPLLKYQPKAQQEGDNLNMPNRSKQPHVQMKQSTFEEQPIKSKYIENVSTTPSNRASVDLNSIKQNQSINIDIMERPIKQAKPASKQTTHNNFDEMPIRGMAAEQIERLYKDDQQPIKGLSKNDLEYYQQFPEKTTRPINNSNKPINAATPKVLDDDRPLTGAKKDFKQLIKQQFPEPFGQQIQEEQSQEKKVEPRNFLKRGSRQHLSSAINKSKQPKNKEEDLNKSGLDRSRDLTPKNQNRSVSQNRVLGKRNNRQANDKSINKGMLKNDSRHDEPIMKNKPPLNPKQKKVSPKIPSKPSNTPKAQQFDTKKKKVRNVFDDNSQSSSQSEDEPFFKTASNKHILVQANDYRIQVIDDVFLTNQQLQLILQKYGKASKPAPKESESQKIQAIRNKYTELCQLVQTEREANRNDLQREKEQFQKYKADQLNKLKNQRRVMQRQLKSGSGNQNLQKQKQQLQTLKQQIEREREDFKKKDKNNRIMIQKYKKENEQLKSKIQRLQSQKESVVGSKRSLNLFKTEQQVDDKSTVSRQSGKPSKKTEEQPISAKQSKQQVNIRDIKKGKETKQPTGKMKYEYAEEETVVKNKPTNVQRQAKIENKWVSHKFNNDSDSPVSDNEEQKQYISSALEWSPTMKLSDLTKIDLSIKMVTDQMISSLFRYETNIEYRRYLQIVKAPGRTVVNSARNTKNQYLANLYNDHSKQHIYDNGTRKETLENGFSIVYFKNGDIKQTLPDQTVLYYFKEKAVDQITLPNKVNIYRFQNNQVELHYPNGYIQIRHPDGTIKVLGEHTRR